MAESEVRERSCKDTYQGLIHFAVASYGEWERSWAQSLVVASSSIIGDGLSISTVSLVSTLHSPVDHPFDEAKPLAVLFAAILAPIYLFILPSFDPCPGLSVAGRLARFDFLGSLLSIGAIVCLIMGINFGGVLYEWNSGSIIALFVVSGVLFIVFALQQIFTVLTTEDNRVFPVHLVRRKEPVLLFIAGSSGGAAIYIALYYIPLYFQFTRGDTAIMAAVRLLPFVFILSAMVLANGFFMAKFGRYTPWYLTGSIITLIGSVLMCESLRSFKACTPCDAKFVNQCTAKIDVNTSASAIYGYEVLIAFGTGSFVQASFAVIQTIVTPAEMSYGITLMLVGRSQNSGMLRLLWGALPFAVPDLSQM